MANHLDLQNRLGPGAHGIELAQADVPRNTLTGGGPSAARDYFIIAGEKRTVEGARIVTYVDDPSWDFSKLTHPDPNRKYLWQRKTEKGLHATTIGDLQTVVDMVVIHSDITSTSRACFNVLKMRGFSTHFLIEGDGTIYQSADPLWMAIHASSELRGNINNFAIGIDMNCLQTNYARSTGEVGGGGDRRMSETIEINGVPWKSWGYTDAQYDALIKLLLELQVHFPKFKLAAPVDERGEIIWQVPEAIDAEKMGIYGHLHLTPQKFDPGPGFDWARLLQGLTKEHNDFPIELVKGVTIASLLTQVKVKQLSDQYYKNTEASELGGFYPIGLGGQWHGGVHLHAKRGTEVHAMMDGVVVCARNGPSAELGSNNFVLLRHEVPFDPKDPKKVFVFYSLYMHLLKFDPNKDKGEAEFKAKGDAAVDFESSPEWVTNARRGNTGVEDPNAPKDEPPVVDKAPKTDPGKKKAKVSKEQQALDDAAAARKKADAEDADEPETPDEEEPDGGLGKDYKPFLDVDKHLAALKRGDVSLFAIDGSDQTRVGAGKVIGRVGNFGDEQGEDGVLHVEVFADGRWRQVVDLLGIHSEHWFELEADTDDNLMVDSDDLLSMVLPEASSRAKSQSDDFVVSNRRIAPDDVLTFFNGDTEGAVLRTRMRRAITRHVSEWSDQVDWFKTMASGQNWEERVQSLTRLLQDDNGRWRDILFARQIGKQLPFIWLTEDVAKHVGLDTGSQWDGLLYHFHPVHFVLWLTFHTNTRVRVLAKGMDKKQLMKLRQKEQKATEERKLRGEFPEDDDHGDAFDIAAVDDVADPAEVLTDMWEVPVQPGEWKRRSDGTE